MKTFAQVLPQYRPRPDGDRLKKKEKYDEDVVVGVGVKVTSGVGSMMKMSRAGAQYEMKLIPVRAHAK